MPPIISPCSSPPKSASTPIGWPESKRRCAAPADGTSRPTFLIPSEIHDLISDDIVERFAIAGTPRECLAQMREFARLGFTSVSMNLAAVRRGTMYEGYRETIASFGEVINEVKRL